MLANIPEARSSEIADSIGRAKQIVANDPNEKRYNIVVSDDRVAKLSKELGEERQRRMALENSRVLRFTQSIHKALGLGHANLK